MNDVNSDSYLEPKDVVLINGLINIHRWGNTFLKTVADIWGSGNVYVIYTNKSKRVKITHYNENVVYVIGKNNYRSGANSVHAQTKEVERKIKILQNNYGLGNQFNMITHSMGGLVARLYIYNNPHTVKNLVTLGTPHHGSPLANYYKWLGFMIGARKAFANLTPEWLQDFNQRFPVKGAPLCKGGKIYTVRGFAKGKIKRNWGIIGETYIAWLTLKFLKPTMNDGLVPAESAVIEGAEHLVDFWDNDHSRLAIRSSIAKQVSFMLREKEQCKSG